jgi:flagellar biosynthesis anti-sigma factor FlgM
MKIGLNTPDPQPLSTETAKKPAAAATDHIEYEPGSDEAAMSQDRVTLSALATQALALPEVRQGLVESLRQSINSGEYQLDPSAIADAILNG